MRPRARVSAIARDGSRSADFVLIKDETRVGRDVDASEVKLDKDPFIAPLHAVFRFEGPQLLVQDSGTPNGVFRPQRLARTWFSSRYYNSPMPYSIFFHRGYAIHGTYEISRLGGPASHGCVRLHPHNAAILYSLVRQDGMRNTRIVIQ